MLLASSAVYALILITYLTVRGIHIISSSKIKPENRVLLYTPAQPFLHHRNPRVSLSHAMNATHGDAPKTSVTPRLHLRTRGSSRHSSASLSSTHRDSPRDRRKRPPPGSTQQPTYVDRLLNLEHWFRGRLRPEILPVPPLACDPRQLPLAFELPSLPTYSRPPANTTGFHRATRFRFSSSRPSAPGERHPTPLHRDGHHSSVSTETTADYLPETLCARAPIISAEPAQVFPADSRIAAPPSIAIWLGWIPRQRHRPIHDTAPPNSGLSGYIRLFAFCAPPETVVEPSCCRYLRDIVSSPCEHRPSTAFLAMTPARGQQPLLLPPT